MRVAATFFALPLLGCSGALADGDGRAFGDDLGTFEVDAALKSSTCGRGALASPEQWEFEVRLSRDDPELYWNTGAASVIGHVADNGLDFTFESQTAVDIAAESEQGPGCTVLRSDFAEGKLDDAGLDVQNFEANLRYKYAAGAESNCSRWIGIAGGFEALPCAIEYAVEGTQSRPPQ